MDASFDVSEARLMVFIDRLQFIFFAGVERERPASADNKNRSLLDDIPHRDSCMGCSY